jgi:hypothetical protein
MARKRSAKPSSQKQPKTQNPSATESTGSVEKQEMQPENQNAAL